MLQQFTAEDGSQLNKSIRTLHAHLDEATYFSRLEKVRGFSHNLVEQYHCITSEVLEMPHRSRKYFPGTNRSNSLGSVACPPFNTDEHNMVEWKVKKDIWSQMAKVQSRVGGPAPPGSEKLERKPESVEPVSFHSLTAKFWGEMIHSHSIAAVCDLAAGPGYVAEASVLERVPYFGLVQTDVHMRVVRSYLFARMWAQMQKMGSLYYEPELVALLEVLMLDVLRCAHTDLSVLNSSLWTQTHSTHIDTHTHTQ